MLPSKNAKSELYIYLHKKISSTFSVTQSLNIFHVTKMLASIRKELFNPKSLTLSVINELKPLLDKKKIFITCADDGIAEEIITDPEVLRQIISNLLVIIIKNISHGTINMVMESNFCGPDSLLMMIEGAEWCVPEAKLSKLFLGKASNLIKVKNLVKQLGGNIKAENGIGKGTTFVVMLPVRHLLTIDFLYDAYSNYIH